MSDARKQAFALAAALLLLVPLAAQLLEWRSASRFNALVESGRIEQALRHDSIHAQALEAWELHRTGRLDAALDAYAALHDRVIDEGMAAHAALDRTLQFNIASILLTQAVAAEADAAEAGDEPRIDAALVELAKENLRQVLRADPDDWDARYNLSRSLELLPDLAALYAEDDVMPERSPRAPKAQRAYDRLP